MEHVLMLIQVSHIECFRWAGRDHSEAVWTMLVTF